MWARTATATSHAPARLGRRNERPTRPVPNRPASFWVPARSALLLGATLCQLALSVTLDSSDPTNDSNYMVMQGDFVYVSGTQNFGTIAARAQMLRSALTASTHFSVAMKIESAPVGTQIDFTLRRSKCDVPSVQVYQGAPSRRAPARASRRANSRGPQHTCWERGPCKGYCRAAAEQGNCCEVWVWGRVCV